ncbi:hypothetical protein LOD99_13751 [Oopsacas minuta]|uniref:CYTH domain-containing protein n=1 Tax=Oopsacas minuta TaxID=111878 RepID=A0AAV7KL09_9METZ|nr:hypothetical protein LOD99_13751 [Oopsacas minuta]
MPQNIEIKARIPDNSTFEALKSYLVRKTQTSGKVISQRDTFFVTPKGRLKLREEIVDHPESTLIYYERTDQPGPKQSDFFKTSVPDPEGMKVVLKNTLGIRGEVSKERLLFMVAQTRVHLDKVAGLGIYMELEVLMEAKQTKEEGVEIAEALMTELKIDKDWLESKAYIDILEAK